MVGGGGHVPCCSKLNPKQPCFHTRNRGAGVCTCDRFASHTISELVSQRGETRLRTRPPQGDRAHLSSRDKWERISSWAEVVIEFHYQYREEGPTALLPPSAAPSHRPGGYTQAGGRWLHANGKIGRLLFYQNSLNGRCLF